MPIWSSEAQRIASSPRLLRGADIQKPAVTLLSICPDGFDAWLCHGCATFDSRLKLSRYFFLVASVNSTSWCAGGFSVGRIETNAELLQLFPLKPGARKKTVCCCEGAGEGQSRSHWDCSKRLGNKDYLNSPAQSL